MKIDFAMLETVIAAGATAGVVLALLKEQFRRDELRRQINREKRAAGKNGVEKKPKTPRVSSKTPRNDNATLDDSPRARLFREGTAALLTLGKTERGARGVIAGWLKQTHDDDQLVLATILRAQGMAVADAAGWITATLRGKCKNGNGNSTMDAFDDLLARATGGEVEGDPVIIDVTPTGH